MKIFSVFSSCFKTVCCILFKCINAKVTFFFNVTPRLCIDPEKRAVHITIPPEKRGCQTGRYYRRFFVEIKCQLDATEVFIADLIACSTCFGHHYAHHQELKSIIQWLLPVVLRALVFKLLVWCGAEGYVSGLQDAAASCKPDT